MIAKDSLLGLPISQAHTAEHTLSHIKACFSKRQSCIVSFINPHSFHLRLHDQAYANALWHFDLVLPDGIGVAMAVGWINQARIERQSFDETSLFHPILHQLNVMKKSVCIIGSKPGVADRACEKMRKIYGDIDYLGTIDGYHSFDEIADWVTALAPDAVIVGMGAPLQESLLLRLKQQGFEGVGFSCGGFLDQYSRETQYYPAWINKWELRWLYRLLNEPSRLWRRYLIEYRTFIIDVVFALGARLLGRRHQEGHLWLARRYARMGS